MVIGVIHLTQQIGITSVDRLSPSRASSSPLRLVLKHFNFDRGQDVSRLSQLRAQLAATRELC
jgi:hypothetical protein